jgi:molybdopterin synthase catalytic subunit
MLISRAPLSLDPLLAEVASSAHGAACVFLGTVRGGPEGVAAIDYSAYPEMAELELARILADVGTAHPGARIAVRHRLGRIPLGEASMAVVAAAPHRAEAFAACREVVEHVKRRVPIWKRELWADGTAEWVDPQGRVVPAAEVPQ